MATRDEKPFTVQVCDRILREHGARPATVAEVRRAREAKRRAGLAA